MLINYFLPSECKQTRMCFGSHDSFSIQFGSILRSGKILWIEAKCFKKNHLQRELMSCDECPITMRSFIAFQKLSIQEYLIQSDSRLSLPLARVAFFSQVPKCVSSGSWNLFQKRFDLLVTVIMVRSRQKGYPHLSSEMCTREERKRSTKPLAG